VRAPARRPTLRVTAVADEADPFAAIATRLLQLPTWIFHGARDDVVPPDDDRVLAAAFRAAGARELRHTEFPGVGHDSWDATYAHQPMWDWLFAQRRSGD
jgi:predicted peptidase